MAPSGVQLPGERIVAITPCGVAGAPNAVFGLAVSCRDAAPPYCDQKVANREIGVWHLRMAIELMDKFKTPR
jgi:hypothetical protein